MFDNKKNIDISDHFVDSINDEFGNYFEFNEENKIDTLIDKADKFLKDINNGDYQMKKSREEIEKKFSGKDNFYDAMQNSIEHQTINELSKLTKPLWQTIQNLRDLNNKRKEMLEIDYIKAYKNNPHNTLKNLSNEQKEVVKDYLRILENIRIKNKEMVIKTTVTIFLTIPKLLKSLSTTVKNIFIDSAKSDLMLKIQSKNPEKLLLTIKTKHETNNLIKNELNKPIEEDKIEKNSLLKKSINSLRHFKRTLEDLIPKSILKILHNNYDIITKPIQEHFKIEANLKNAKKNLEIYTDKFIKELISNPSKTREMYQQLHKEIESGKITLPLPKISKYGDDDADKEKKAIKDFLDHKIDEIPNRVVISLGMTDPEFQRFNAEHLLSTRKAIDSGLFTAALRTATSSMAVISNIVIDVVELIAKLTLKAIDKLSKTSNRDLKAIYQDIDTLIINQAEDKNSLKFIENQEKIKEKIEIVFEKMQKISFTLGFFKEKFNDNLLFEDKMKEINDLTFLHKQKMSEYKNELLSLVENVGRNTSNLTLLDVQEKIKTENQEFSNKIFEKTAPLIVNDLLGIKSNLEELTKGIEKKVEEIQHEQNKLHEPQNKQHEPRHEPQYEHFTPANKKNKGLSR